MLHAMYHMYIYPMPFKDGREERALESVDDDSRDSNFDCSGFDHTTSTLTVQLYAYTYIYAYVYIYVCMYIYDKEEKNR